MRPLRLDLAGFTVFREPTTIDFSDADFFALVGPTGSGKSTVLDAVCFALYGTVPRWGDRRAIANALAPSANEARVRLVFEAAGARYVLTRVVRRDGKGAVATRQAGLEALPPGFDLRRFDTGLADEDLGEVLAGTAGEVDVAVADVVGLPYEQFTKCVVLPQGDFAAFLHAKPAERQRILVNLLGLEVYGRVRERANTLAATAQAQVTATGHALASLADADDEAVATAAERVTVLRGLVADVDAILPELADARRAGNAATEALAALDAEIARLAEIRPPDEAETLAAAAAAARSAQVAAAEAVSAAEEREEAVRADLAGAGDPVAIRRALDEYADRERLAAESAEAASTVADAEAEHDRAVAELADARRRADAARAELDAAREAYQAALAADRASALRAHLRPGEPCPVCTRPVETVPPVPDQPAVAAAEAAGTAARRAADAAERATAVRDAAVRDLDRALAGARAHAQQLAARRAELDQRLSGVPTSQALRDQLDAITALRADLDQATAAVRRNRAGQRSAAMDAERTEARLRDAWRAFDATRDALAPFAPPPADRDDLAVSWAELDGWARSEAARRRLNRPSALDAVDAAARAAAEVANRIIELFTAAQVAIPVAARGSGAGRAGSSAGSDGRAPTPGWDGAPAGDLGDPARVAAVAVERAEAAHLRVRERRAEAVRLREQRAGYERDAQVARALAGHLRADRFERWLLAEALDALVQEASRILRELSGGQYDLGHDKGEFFVVDHHDASLRRAVRTLSGGETFQASLALALALSDQLAGMSTTTTSLESIMLDEGFGTLDAATLDTVAATLESLAARGDRMVGVVTHVPALAERIPVRFEVTRDARSARVQRVGV